EQRGTVTNGTADSASLSGKPVILLDLGGRRLQASLGSPAARASDEECATPWPVLQLASDSALSAWQVGFVGGEVTAVAADTLAGLSAADSATLVATAARLASALPVAEEAYFRGLPFAVRSLQRFSPAPGVQAFAAALVRRVNQEDSPFEERTFMIAEREGEQGRWRVAHQERSTGTEDEVESAESLAPLAVGDPGRAMLLVVREHTDGLSYRLLQRTGPAKWRVQWTSAVGKCGG
ncbi:MAG TPA: hypothetical protein VEA99_07435, partial [Gemmatimonadaceae bacterium]|nr:hypothetical protein [Gemmatimonadaceae bacterium]